MKSLMIKLMMLLAVTALMPMQASALAMLNFSGTAIYDTRAGVVSNTLTVTGLTNPDNTVNTTDSIIGQAVNYTLTRTNTAWLISPLTIGGTALAFNGPSIWTASTNMAVASYDSGFGSQYVNNLMQNISSSANLNMAYTVTGWLGGGNYGYNTAGSLTFLADGAFAPPAGASEGHVLLVFGALMLLLAAPRLSQLLHTPTENALKGTASHA